MISMVIFTNNQATLGEHHRKKQGEGNLEELNVEVAKLIVHPKHNPATQDNDISILYLAQEVDLTTYTPVCLPKVQHSKSTAYNGKRALAVGNLKI